MSKSREIAIRAWDELTKRWNYFTIGQAWSEYQKRRYSRLCNYGVQWFEFTNCLDKITDRIYEGDIVDIENGEDTMRTQCIFDKGIFTLIDKAGGNWTWQLRHHPDRLKIVGNIVEHPNLLGE